MSVLKRFSFVMQHPVVYRAWQAPFVRAKVAPLLRHHDFTQAHRVLDVGCGPGTNARLFANCDYLGLDCNPDYIETARRSCPGRFFVADACDDSTVAGQRFDVILLNSLLHHIAAPDVRRMLGRLSRQLAEGGHVHILDLVLPQRPGVARYLARSDRGDYPRGMDEWQELFGEHFEPVVCEPYSVGWLGIPLWQMIYFKGRAR